MAASSERIKDFLKSKYFLTQLGLMIGAVLGFFLLISLFLRWFTHHGEALPLPDYIGKFIEEARTDAERHNFKLEVIDSVYVVGKNGGIILSQSPRGETKVKRKRTIYVTVTKGQADEIPSGRLPVLYGKSYERKSRELKNGFEIYTTIAGYAFDPGPENYILAVIYNGDTIVSATERRTDVMIEKGATLSCILSKSSGGELNIPNLVCKPFSEAIFLARSLNIKLLDESLDGELDDRYSAYIHRQEPSFDPGNKITMGDTIMVFLRKSRPDFCPDEPDEE